MTKALAERSVIRLRSEPLIVSADEFRKVFGLDEDRRPLEYIQNEYEEQEQGKVVVDHATGLMWQKSGSKGSMTHDKTQGYIDQLNKEQFAGYTDWRLPTIPELMSLLEPEKQENGMYLDPIFVIPDVKYYWCWSADRLSKGASSESAWLVHFNYGDVSWNFLNGNYYVRAVRP